MRRFSPAFLLLLLALVSRPGLAEIERRPASLEPGAVREPGFEPALGPPSSAASEPAAACSAQHGAAAYVCCDGEGGFTVCRGRAGGHRLLLGCVDRHEDDHLAWFAEHLPDACQARPRGACRFEMTPDQLRELECSGYRSEFRCLNASRGLAGGRRDALGDLLWRQKRLREEAEGRFACRTGDW